MSDARFSNICTHLERLCPEPYHAAALAMLTPQGTLQTAHFSAARGLEAPRFRVASISKAVTAGIACELAAAGRLDLAMPLPQALDLGVHPKASRLKAITLDHLLSHTSGLTDHEGYIIEPPETPATFLARRREALGPEPPGRFFRYANLNYVLLGSALEHLTGTRFDRLAREHVLAPLGVKGNFNWAGTAQAVRRSAFPLLQRQDDGGLILQADGADADWHADILWRRGHGLSLANHRLGLETIYFSPHAGLRASVGELAHLASWFARDTPAGRLQREIRWRFDPAIPNGEDCNGLFPAVSRGLTHYRGHPQIPGHLLGHAGDALGFAGGAWWAPETRTAWAYVLTGTRDLTADLGTEAFYPEVERHILASLSG